jgi:hypothetical protein
VLPNGQHIQEDQAIFTLNEYRFSIQSLKYFPIYNNFYNDYKNLNFFFKINREIANK